MRGPLNKSALEQIRRILDLIEATNDPSATLKIWMDDDYASLEVASTHLPINDLRMIVGASPLEADEVRAIEERKEAARRAASRSHYYD